MRACSLLLLIAAATLPASPALANKPCEIVHVPESLGEAAEAEVVVRSGFDCAIRIKAAERLEAGRSEVTAPPSYGGARPQGLAGASYRSNPGYKGRDGFTLTLCRNEGGRASCSDVRVKVRVR